MLPFLRCVCREPLESQPLFAYRCKVSPRLHLSLTIGSCAIIQWRVTLYTPTILVTVASYPEDPNADDVALQLILAVDESESNTDWHSAAAHAGPLPV